MSYTSPSLYKYIFTGKLTPLLEEKTEKLLNNYDKDYALIRYYDQDKLRSIILVSIENMTPFLCNIFNKYNMELEVFFNNELISKF